MPALYLEFRVGAAPPPALNLTNNQKIVYNLLFLILRTPKAFFMLCQLKDCKTSPQLILCTSSPLEEVNHRLQSV